MPVAGTGGGTVELCFELPVAQAVALLEDQTFVHSYAPYLALYHLHDHDHDNNVPTTTL